jgi:hypothetical protein
MPNKILAATFVVSAIALGGQSYAQAPVAEPANKAPVMSPTDTVKTPDTPAERVAPKAGTGFDHDRPSHKSKSRRQSKPKGGKPKSDGVTAPLTGTSSNSTPGSQ